MEKDHQWDEFVGPEITIHAKVEVAVTAHGNSSSRR